MKKKVLSVFFACILLLCGFLMVGCRDPFTDGEDGEDNVENKVTITVGILNEPGEQETMRKFKREFEKINDQINIRITYFPGSYEQAMATYIRKPEDMPDIVWTGSDKHAAFSSSGHFVDLTEYFARSEETNLDNYYASMIETTHYNAEDTGIWFAPRDYNKPVTYLNTTMIEKAGLTVPSVEEWNYETFLQLCRDLREVMDNEENNTLEQKQAGLVKNSVPCDGDLTWAPVYLAYTQHLGGSLIDGTQINIREENSLLAYEEIHEVIAERLISNPQTDTADSFLKKSAAMWFTVRPRMQAVVNTGMEFDFRPLPFDYSGVGCSGYAITTQATKRVSQNIAGNTKNNAEYAWEFIKFIITEPGQEVFGEIGTGVPVLKSLATDGKWLEYYSADLNHQAFIGTEEEDINVNVFSQFPADKQYDATTALNGLFMQIGKEANWTNGKPNATFTQELDSIYTTISGYLS